MSIVSAKELSFSYPDGRKALDKISFDIPEGSFVTVCGVSGCGKSTLLRLMKRGLAPHGEISGVIRYCGAEISSVPLEDAARDVGFVMQDPESQIVTDKVWHELAFSLESVGFSSDEIRRRVGEMASYFGLENVFEREAASLSGGQKQLLNLASAAALHPKLLLLDEPTSQLDPIAANSFIDAVSRLNRDFGVTIIIAEHRLEELLYISDRVMVMEHGRIIADCSPREICTKLPKDHEMMSAMPVSVRAYSIGGGIGNCPLSVREGRTNELCRRVVEGMKADHPLGLPETSEVLISAHRLWVSYGRSTPDVLKDTSLEVMRGRIYAVLGGNGSGKTTLLKCLAGMMKPLGGSVKQKKNIVCAYLPQNPCEIFTEDTVKEELFRFSGWEDMADLFELTGLVNSHPYDLSGGERQRLALAKLLLKKPDVLLLDEPTKGIDASAKTKLCGYLKSIADNGAAVVLVTHDTELAAGCADICGLLFNGEIVSEGRPYEFFSENYFYTTPARRLAKGINDSIITLDNGG